MSQDVFERWVGGDDRAFDALYQMYYNQIFNFATALIGNRAEGEDLAQETFMRLLRHRSHLQQVGISHGRALIYTIARRLAYQYSAYRARWAKLADYSSAVVEAAMADKAVSPDELLAAAETGVYVKQAIDSLSEPHREVILLRHQEFLKYEEMAEILTCSVSQIKARLHYARRLLRERLIVLGMVP